LNLKKIKEANLLENVYKELQEVLPKEKILLNEPMSKHTTFKVGGKADLFVTISSSQELQQVIKIINKSQIPFFILGNGSNVIVLDTGFKGIVLKIDIKDLSIKENYIEAGAGTLLSKISYEACKNNLSGFEFASRYTRYIRWSCKNECRCIWFRNKRCVGFYKIH